MARSTAIRTASGGRKKTKSKTKQNKKPLLQLPENVQAFLARRLVDICAVILLGLALFSFAACLTYSKADPSANSSAPAQQAVENIMGASGAWMADFLIQPFGAIAFLWPAIFLIWALRLWRRHRLSPSALRVAASIGAALCLAIAFATKQTEWSASGFAGGAFGVLVFNKLSTILPLAHWLLQAIAGAAGMALFYYAAAITKQEAATAIRFMIYCARQLVITVVNGIIAFRNWIAHYNNPDYKPAPLIDRSLLKWESFLPEKQYEPDIAPLQEAAPKAKPAPKTAAATAAATAPAEPVADLPAQTQSNIPVVKPKERKEGAATHQSSFNLENSEWELPTIEMLSPIPPMAERYDLNEEALRKNAQLLQNVLADFKVEGEIVSIHPGPVVTLYELVPAPGTKSARVIGLADDIARSMAAVSVRCAVVPGRNVIGIEIPNKTRQIVYMQEMLGTDLMEKSKAHLPLILGKDIGGQPILADLAKMPHLLVAGTTGSGKSVAVNTMILSLLYHHPPEKCRMIMIDPKMLELSVYGDIPHLLSPVVTEPGKAIVALKWTVQEMENRYRAMSKLGVRNIEGYNQRMRQAQDKDEVIMERVHTGFDETGAPTYEEQPMDTAEIPYIVVIVDEFADLMLVAGKDVENAIQRLAQMARAAGIHLIMATQRPSVDVITGVVKANFPTRISFQVTSKIDSRTILGEGGAEQLLGMGDMLYMAPGGRITRVHGPFVSDSDVEKVVNFLKKQGAPAYLESITDESGDIGGDSEVMNAMFGGGSSEAGNAVDELYDQAVAVVAREGKASTSFIQRHLQIGYNRAARIVEEMERQGVISPANATGKRSVLVQDHSDV